MKNKNFKIIKRFGPSVLKVRIPISIVNKLNKYIDDVVKSKSKSNKLAYGEKNPLEGKKCGIVVTGHVYKVQAVAYHLSEVFNILGFDMHPDNVFTWQRSLDPRFEQEDDNNDPLAKFLKSEEGERQVKSFLKGLCGNIDEEIIIS